MTCQAKEAQPAGGAAIEEKHVEKVYGSCVAQLRDFVHNAGFEHAVIGLSGGIDSALVAAMATDALGAENVHGVLMPGPFSSVKSSSDAEELAGNLGIDAHVVSINQAYKAFSHCFTVATGTSLEGLAAENTQARCRTVVLMAFSNSFGWLMLNTGNRSEGAMGYSTLYGDTAGAFAPLGGLYKTQVYQLANWLNARAAEQGSGEVIPQSIIVKPPSAELSPCQTDEASLGIDYATLDRILVELVDNGRQAEEVAAMGFSPEQVTRVRDRYEASAFKRELEPPYAEVSIG